MNYAVVLNNKVINVVLWDGEGDWEPNEGIAYPCDEGVSIGWSYIDGVFSPPPVPPKPDSEIILENTHLKDSLMGEATNEINLLTDATDPDIMGEDINPDDVVLLKAWKKYRVELSRVIDMLNPVWPVKPNV